ncbi:MAG: class I SAM-dependent methyltransferase [Methyloceanibacter sp.]
MDDALRPRRTEPGAEAIAKAHAVYTPRLLSVYDLVVHGLSNPFAWRCPTKRLTQFYETNLSANHLEAGVGTGFFIDSAGHAAFDRLVLLDINENCLGIAAKRLARFAPVRWQASLFELRSRPGGPATAPFDSIGLTYVLHCLPGTMMQKLGVIDRLRTLMRPRAALFGATILGRGIVPNGAARALLALYNSKGVFNNRVDDLARLTEGLEQRFAAVKIETYGCVALFRAT